LRQAGVDEGGRKVGREGLQDSFMTHRLGVFATAAGWVLADEDRMETFETRDGAVEAALKLAHIARWRGAEVEVVAQHHPGGPLNLVEQPPA
jgi:sugar phosphate isomerase/epimerase